VELPAQYRQEPPATFQAAAAMLEANPA